MQEIMQQLIGNFTNISNFCILSCVTVVIGLVIAYFIRSFVKNILPVSKWKPAPTYPKEVHERALAEFQPDEMIPDTPKDDLALHPPMYTGRTGKYVTTADGKRCLNLNSPNFLGLLGSKEVEKHCKEAISRYGVGSCGPRGFYGTADVHIKLEEELAVFMKCEEAVLYSNGLATVATALKAYASSKDVIFVDKGVHFPVQTGVRACRTKTIWFEHNDMNDLEKKLEEATKMKLDRKNKEIVDKSRFFIVIEGLYGMDGSICPLREIVKLKWKYCARIMIDESFSFFALGKTGRGVIEHFDIDPIEVDLVVASLENSLGGIGGFCCGRSYVISHQRLSGLGYCFSASLPPLLATAASECIRIVREEPDRLEQVQRSAEFVHEELTKAFDGTRWSLHGEAFSPLKYVQWKGAKAADNDVLDELCAKALLDGIFIQRSIYLDDKEAFEVAPSVRIAIHSDLSDADLRSIVSVVSKLAREINKSSKS